MHGSLSPAPDDEENQSGSNTDECRTCCAKADEQSRVVAGRRVIANREDTLCSFFVPRTSDIHDTSCIDEDEVEALDGVIGGHGVELGDEGRHGAHAHDALAMVREVLASGVHRTRPRYVPEIGHGLDP